MNVATGATWAIAGLSTAGVIIRPMRWPEWIWAIAGAALLVAMGLIPTAAAGSAIAKGTDVYLFLIGMMLISEAARDNGVFDWVAAFAVNRAGGSPRKLLLLVYTAGVIVTTFMSNDATAVVLTPAIFAAARKAKAEPLPLLFACAMVANAASFVLPISNPANLVLYGAHLPPLEDWLASFAVPSIAAIAVTYGALRLVQRKSLSGRCSSNVEVLVLSMGGKLAIGGIVGTALLLILCSSRDLSLGMPTALAGLGTAVGISLARRRSPIDLIGQISWGVLALVAGLFVLVEALDRTGVTAMVANAMRSASEATGGAYAAPSALLAIASNLINNLPAGLIASTAIAQAQPSRLTVDGLLIGVDLGPNLSVTGSLATILWLQAIRREGENVGFLSFLKVGAIAMPLALGAALAARLLMT